MRKIGVAILVVGLLAGVAWWQRQPMVAWYRVRQLTYAHPDACDGCARMVADLDEAAVPSVLDGLQDSDFLICSNMQHALGLMVKQWGLIDARSQRLVECLNSRFDGFSAAGQEKAVLLLTAFLQLDGPRPIPPRLAKVISSVLVNAEKKSELRGPALLLAGELVECVEPGQWVDVCREMALRGLQEDRTATRIAAMQLLCRAPMRRDKATLAQLVPLLRDGDVSVRRAALVALAPETDVVREEAFLPLLHDDDAQVQYLCEMALRKRRLTDDEINLARMISDKNPAIRNRVVLHFAHMPELNLAEWLRQLSNDPEPAVRATAVRAAGEHPQVDMTERLREMAERDPNASVRQNARFYLQQRSRRVALD